jgi:hypothetical protein
MQYFFQVEAASAFNFELPTRRQLLDNYEKKLIMEQNIAPREVRNEGSLASAGRLKQIACDTFSKFSMLMDSWRTPIFQICEDLSQRTKNNKNI